MQARDSDIGQRMPGALGGELADRGGAPAAHSGTQAGLNETTGTDDTSADPRG